MSSQFCFSQPCNDCFRLAQLEAKHQLPVSNGFFYKKWCNECVTLANINAARARQFSLSHNLIPPKPIPTGNGGFVFNTKQTKQTTKYKDKKERKVNNATTRDTDTM